LRNKIFLLLQLFLLGALVLVMQQSDKVHKIEIQNYESRLIKVENRYLDEKEKHEQTKLELAYTKRIVSDKDMLMRDFVTSEYAGEFDVSYYTAGPESTGKIPDDPFYGITASGDFVLEGYTAAADWAVFEPGTRLFIEGVGFRVVRDSGSAIKGNKLDVFVDDVNVALANGRHMAKVYVLK